MQAVLLTGIWIRSLRLVRGQNNYLYTSENLRLFVCWCPHAYGTPQAYVSLLKCVT